MATFNKFDQFVEDKNHGVHDLATDALTVFLCAAANAPVAANSVLADLTVISYSNLSTRVIGTPTSSAQTSGVYKLVLPDLVLTASGTVATFRYVGIYNDTTVTPTDALIGWWDYGSNLTLTNLETLTLDFSAANGVIQDT